MADVELVPVIGGVRGGYALRAPELTGDIDLYVLTEKSSYWICERLALKVGSLALEGALGEASNGDGAQAWVEKDWSSHCNYIRWAKYMGSNPPPR